MSGRLADIFQTLEESIAKNMRKCLGSREKQVARLNQLADTVGTLAVGRVRAPTMSDKATRPKESKVKARYTPKGTNQEHCGICRHFVAPDMCRVVQGRVVSRGWCRHFSKEAA